jgi:hypothetical protein
MRLTFVACHLACISEQRGSMVLFDATSPEVQALIVDVLQ